MVYENDIESWEKSAKFDVKPKNCYLQRPKPNETKCGRKYLTR